MTPERDFTGYGENPPEFSWPGGNTLALSIVFNYEEGGEHSFARDGIVETIGEFGPVDRNVRDMGMESAYEYGQRVGIWRILDFLRKNKITTTFYATALALEANKKAAERIVKDGHEICDHGYSWNELFRLEPDLEREEIRKSVESIEKITGKKPAGFYAREPSESTLNILKDFPNFIYDSDSYSDDLPYFQKESKILIIPYTPDANDFHFQNPMNRFSNSEEFYSYLVDTFDTLYQESKSKPKIMSAAFHVRVIGRPGRFPALVKFFDYVKNKQGVWIATREEIAKFWIEKYGSSLEKQPSP